MRIDWSYSLDNLARDWINMRKNEKMLRATAKDWGVDPKADMWLLPPSKVGAYAEQDALMTLKLMGEVAPGELRNKTYGISGS